MRHGKPGRRSAAAAAAEVLVRRKPTMWSALWRYGVVGGSGVLVNLGILYLLHLVLGLGFTRSSAIATESAIIWNYLANELWTFHHRRLSWRRLAKFNASALVGLVTTVTVATLVQQIAHPLAAQVVGIASGAALNFGLNFFWTWRR
jgi:dolichol-phosphate mannosyltransferase